MTFGVYADGRLASSIRFHVANQENMDCPAMMVFSDYLQPLIDAGMTIIDPTRFVVDPVSARLYPKLPHLTVRIPWVACDHFDADIGLATVRAEHQPFYKRLFGHTVACDPRPYPSLAKPISLMVLDIRKAREYIYGRYPFLRSTESERRALFGPPPHIRRAGRITNLRTGAMAGVD